MKPEQLATLAAQARTHAYAPYSGFCVGAALLTENGDVFTGCNIENASYGLSMCAERTAVFRAVSDGQRSFDSMVLSTSGAAPPCGACRQVLNEFNPTMKVYLADEQGTIALETTLDTLLPGAFGPENLD